MIIYKTVNENDWIEAEYRDVQYFSTVQKAEQYIEREVEEVGYDDEEDRGKRIGQYAIYEITLDEALEQ